MTNPKFWQDHLFDPAATFIVANWRPGFTHKGSVPKSGAIFDKSGVRPDRLRSLYESRWIRIANPGELAQVAPSHTDLMVGPETIDISPDTDTDPTVDGKAAYAEKAAAAAAEGQPARRKRG